MKVAVLISGLVKSGHRLGDLKRFNKIFKEKFSRADFYYGTWDSNADNFEKNFPNEKCHYFPEPENHYHPYIDVPIEAHVSKYFTERVEWAKKLPLEKKKWTAHHVKQHLIHCMLFDKLEEEYDIIVRARFDGFIHKAANFDPYIKDTYETGVVHGFTVTRKDMFDKFYDSPMEKGSKHEVYMLDQLIIHHAKNIDTRKVYELYQNKQLHAAEFGWYQILSMPYNGHKNHHGFVNHDKNVLDKFLLDN